MMRINCLLLTLMFTLSSIAYASSVYYCPSSVNCAEANKVSSCSLSSNASLWKLAKNADSLKKGTYDLVLVTNASNGIQCIYYQSPVKEVGNSANWIRFTSKASYIPKTDINNKWDMGLSIPECPKESNNTKITPTICPFQSGMIPF